MTLRERIEARLRQLERRSQEQAAMARDEKLSRSRRSEAAILGTAYADLYYWLVKDLEECGK